MSELRYINNLKVGDKIDENAELVLFEGIATTDSLNSYFYRMHSSSLRNMKDDAAKEPGQPVYINHETYRELNAGRTCGASLYNKKVKMEWSILRGLTDIGSDDVIKRLENGVVTDLSVGHYDAKYMCDECGSEMNLGWYMPMDENGHYPGMVIKKNGKDHTITAEAHNARLRELSVVGMGADPDAKIIGKLKQELSDGEINGKGIAFLSEFYNLNHSNFFNELGYNGYVPKLYSIPPLQSYKGSDKPRGNLMNDKNLLEKANEDLQAANEALQQENEEFKTQIADLPTHEELEALQRENAQLQDQMTSEDIETLKLMAKEGEAYISILRIDGKAAFKAKLMSDGIAKDKVEEHPEYLGIVKDIDECTNVKQLYQWQQSYYRQARSNRAAGRVSQELNDYTTHTDEDKTRFVKGKNDIR